MLTRTIAAVVAILVVSALTAVPASADGGFGTVDCSTRPDIPECQVSVGIPGRPGGSAGGDARGSGSSSGGSGCYYSNSRVGRPPPAGRGPAGGWYVRVCPMPDGGASQGEAVWLDTGPTPEPESLAHHAASRLRLPTPLIRTSPDSRHDVLVQVPVWLWVDPTTWGPRSATASVPGMSITATAIPTSTRWSTGDGAVVECRGAGTPWTAASDPGASSPTCGYVYRTSSAAAPGNVFVLRATVMWTVTWSGGGRSGTVPELSTSSAVDVRAAESQAINGGGS